MGGVRADRDPKPAPRSRRRRLGAALFVILAVAALSAYGLDRLRRDRGIRAEAEAARRLVDEGRFQEAQPYLLRWLAAEPRSAEALFLVARGTIDIGLVEEGLAGLDRAEALGHPPAEVRRERAFALLKLGRAVEAEPILRDLSKSARPDPEVDEALARLYLESFRLREAAEAIDRWMAGAPDDPRPYLWRTEIGRRTNAGIAALSADYAEALRLDPGNREAHLGLGEVLSESNRFDEALGHFEAVLAKRPDDPAANLGMGRSLAGLGREADARAHLERAASGSPRDARPLVELAKIALRKGALDEALSRLDRAVAADPSEPETHYHRALVLSRLGRVEDARRESELTERLRSEHAELPDLMRSLYRRPDDPELQYRAARWMFDHGRTAEGLRWAETILARHPEEERTHALLAEHFDRQGDAGRANYHRLRSGRP